MKLAEVIHKALMDPKFRLALESGTVRTSDLGLSTLELDTIAEVLRSRKPVVKEKLFSQVAAWRDDS